MEPPPHPTLEIDNDPRQQSLEWTAQRVACVLFTALLLAITFGLFGRGGPLSQRTVHSPDNMLGIEYDRFMRYHSPDVIRVTVKASSDTVRLRMAAEYARNIQIERITPQPDSEMSDEDAVTFVFNAKQQSRFHATFHFSPQKYGGLDGWIGLAGGPPVAFQHFIYP